ncbi:type II toxin-antitoxin system Phd/YefM family antitoxin [Paraburkholderia bannensis]|uniref:type II toxin-antitoxin system Phd/YefM family antitoxin n=1 Tax=Paraburkholderia bannensis TaxID=765414 RepID=UPI002AB27F11|nr:type II toxin-antitoxin system prevent-host-death family antitoxin [Paraburkholderia bannensis]
MPIVDIDDAAQCLSGLIDRALAGEEVVIGRAGKPVVRLVPVEPVKANRRFGALKGSVRVADHFDAPQDESI